MKKSPVSLTVLLFVLFVSSIYAFGGSKEQFCRTYADKAVAQYNQARQHNLPGIIPPAWSNDRNGHYNWCMVSPENIVNTESMKRQAYLDQYIPRNISNGTLLKNMAGSQKFMTTKKVSVLKKSQGKINSCYLIHVNKNIMLIKFDYKIDPSIKGPVYSGAFLYDTSQHAVDAGYKPGMVQKLPQSSALVSLVLPAKPFYSASVKTFLIHGGKIFVTGRFNLSFSWNGKSGSMVNLELTKMK